MPTRKVSGPSLFCEWVVGTTIPSAIKPPPAPKPQLKSRFRDVVKVHVTTDDESEEDTVRITYPRTGRTMPHRLTPPPAPPSEPEEVVEGTKEIAKEETKEEVKEEAPEEPAAEEVVKKVRFEDSTKAVPIKSALKKTKTPSPESDETSDSGTEGQTDSEAEGSDDSAKALKNKRQKKKKNKQKLASETDSEYDSDPHPTCKCESCAKGREMLSKVCKKHEKSDSDASVETSESEIDTDTSSAKGKKGNGGNGKKGGGRKGKDSDTEAETSDSSKDASESDVSASVSEKPTKGKSKAKDKGAKREEPKSEESDTAAETSDSQPEISPKSKKQPSKKDTKKGDQTKQQKKQTPPKKKKKDPDPEAEPQPGSGVDADADDEAEEKAKEEEPASSKKQPRKKDQKNELSLSEQPAPKSSKPRGEKKKAINDNNPEGFPLPHIRRPNLIQPVRAEVVQTERVVEGPLDPPPNAYYDPSHNIVRVYYGPVYGSHHGYALYPGQGGDARPLPVGTPHPTQNPYLYALNNQQLQPPQLQPQPHPQIQSPHQGYGYNKVPVTQGMPMAQWNGMAPPPGFPHVPPPGPPVAHQGSQDMKADDEPYMSGALPPPPNKDRDRGSFGNAESNDSKEPKNPYYNPSRTRSQFSAYGSAGRRQVSKETHHSAQNGDQKGFNQAWGNNDGAGDQSGGWENQNKNNEQNGWGGGSSHSQQQQNPGGWGSHSNQGSQRSTGTQRKQGGHWGDDTFPQPRYGSKYGSKDWDKTGDNQPQSDNVPATNDWGENAGNAGDGYPDGTKSNVMPGTWVDAPAASCPAWGDPTCAVDTGGAAANW